MPVSSSDVFIVHDNKVLLLLRDDIPTIPNPNTWCLVGGTVDEGETIDETVRRESFEEIGIVPESIEYIGKRIGSNGGVSGFYFARLNDQEVKNIRLGDEGQELKFFSFDELKEIKLASYLGKYFEEFPEKVEKLMKGEKISDPEYFGLEK